VSQGLPLGHRARSRRYLLVMNPDPGHGKRSRQADETTTHLRIHFSLELVRQRPNPTPATKFFERYQRLGSPSERLFLVASRRKSVPNTPLSYQRLTSGADFSVQHGCDMGER
jgi:hypothetical protein